MGQRGTNIDDPVRVAVPVEELEPWAVVSMRPHTSEIYLSCAECGNEVDDDGLWPERNIHKPRQIGPWCGRCGHRWRYLQHPNSIKAILDHNATHTWRESNYPTPQAEVSRVPNRLHKPVTEVLPAAGINSTLPVMRTRREPRVIDKMRELQEEIAEDMVRPYKEALALRPDEEIDSDGNPRYQTPELLRLLHSQARMAERLMDRTIGTPVQRNANLNIEAGAIPGKDISMRAVDETLLDLINGELQLVEE